MVDWTSLHIAAAFNGHQDCVQVLIEGGADASATNNEGQTPLLLAAQKYLFSDYRSVIIINCAFKI